MFVAAVGGGGPMGPPRPFRGWNLTQRVSQRFSSNSFFAPWGKWRLRTEARLSSQAQSWTLRGHTGDLGKGKESKEALPLISQEVCWAPPWGAPGQTCSPAPDYRARPRSSSSRTLPLSQQENRKAELSRLLRPALDWRFVPQEQADSRVTEKVTLLLGEGAPPPATKK